MATLSYAENVGSQFLFLRQSGLIDRSPRGLTACKKLNDGRLSLSDLRTVKGRSGPKFFP